jgi:hypothetical protein
MAENGIVELLESDPHFVDADSHAAVGVVAAIVAGLPSETENRPPRSFHPHPR